MLKLLKSIDQLAVSEATPFGCKIRSAAAAYGMNEPSVQFWAQEGGPVVARIDGQAVLEDGGKMDAEEIAAFLRTLGLESFACSGEAARKLGLPVSTRGEIMALGQAGTGERPLADVVWNPGPREIYAVLEQARSEHFPVPEFEPFYMDLAFRTRHGAALTAGVRQGGRLVACALCTALTRQAAVVSAVACVPGLRRRGYGRAALAELARRLGRAHLYVFRADGENEAFYRALGFAACGRWAQARRKGETP